MKKVTIYTTPTCHFCHLAKDYFKENNVAYEEYNVAENMEKRTEMLNLTGQMAVPVIKIDDYVTIGFDQAKVEELLAA
jgi:glutaredoxin 3